MLKLNIDHTNALTFISNISNRGSFSVNNEKFTFPMNFDNKTNKTKEQNKKLRLKEQSSKYKQKFSFQSEETHANISNKDIENKRHNNMININPFNYQLDLLETLSYDDLYRTNSIKDLPDVEYLKFLTHKRKGETIDINDFVFSDQSSPDKYMKSDSLIFTYPQENLTNDDFFFSSVKEKED